MKTPREFLLEKHRHAGPALDRIRSEAVAKVSSGSKGRHAEVRAIGKASPMSWPVRLISNIWSELFAPCRRVWTGIAATWAAIACLHLMTTDDLAGIASSTSMAASQEDSIRNYLDNRQLLMAELGIQFTDAPVATQPDPVTRPRSERTRPTAMA